jgi:hypothetical protein
MQKKLLTLTPGANADRYVHLPTTTKLAYLVIVATGFKPVWFYVSFHEVKETTLSMCNTTI